MAGLTIAPAVLLYVNRALDIGLPWLWSYAPLGAVLVYAALHRQQMFAALAYLGIQGLLIEARRRGMRIEQLALLSSGDTAGDRHAVVGYGAWALWEEEPER